LRRAYLAEPQTPQVIVPNGPPERLPLPSHHQPKAQSTNG
jgi:hypothetical protein